MSQIDLHCHSNASDGSLSPGALVDRAKQQGVSLLALTDHDCTDGLAEAHKAAQQQQITLVKGVEASALWHGHTIHITGLNINPDTPALQQLLETHQAFRLWRGNEMGRKLEKAGIENATAGATALASGLITRTHYAQFLLQQGYVSTLQKAFDKYLLKGKAGYVRGDWSSIETVVAAIHAAGGLACIAHPKRYKMTNTKLNRLFALFKEAGGNGIEVVNSNSPKDQIAYLAQCAQTHALAASVGSDFHFPGGFIELGKLAALPAHCQPIWQQF